MSRAWGCPQLRGNLKSQHTFKPESLKRKPNSMNFRKYAKIASRNPAALQAWAASEDSSEMTHGKERGRRANCTAECGRPSTRGRGHVLETGPSVTRSLLESLSLPLPFMVSLESRLQTA